MKPACFVCLLFVSSLLAQTNPAPAAGLMGNVFSGRAFEPEHQVQSKLAESYGRLPLSFEPNVGQIGGHIEGSVSFLTRGAGYNLFLTKNGLILSLRQKPSQGSSEAVRPEAVLQMQLLGARPETVVRGTDQLPGKTNYLRGNDPEKWNTNIANYAKVHYANIFDGVDLVYYGNQGHLEYDFVVGVGADANSIHLAFKGAREIRIDRRTGDLVLNMGQGIDEVRFRKPVAYQTEEVPGDRKRLVAANYTLDSESRVSFKLGAYDHDKPLLIDPILSYSTYLGGSSDDYGDSIAVDSAGSAYVTGYTNSINFPVTAGAFQGTCSGGCSGTTLDAFVTKLDPTGSFLIYSTYLGGTGNDYGNGIVLDAAGDAYIVGQTFSINFPTTAGAFQTSCGKGDCLKGDAFIAELNPSGSALVYSTYLGGSNVNQGNGIALDAANNAYVIGYTQSTDFPTTPGAFKTSCVCTKNSSVFVTELNAAGSALVYSTYLGGNAADVGYQIALDSFNNAYVTGYATSRNFPTTPGAFQTTIAANRAAFVTKINPTGSALVYSTFLGGSTTLLTTPCEACGTSIAVDGSGNAYVVGLTAEANFPITPGAYQSVFKSATNGHDAFITKINATGSGLVFSTYLGGSGDDGATGVSVDGAGNVWLKGNTHSADFPITPGAFQTKLKGVFNAYVAEFDPTGSQLLYSSYLGGSGTEFGGATRVLALDGQLPPNVYVTGYTDSTDFPTTVGSFQTTAGGLNDAFVSKFAPSPIVVLSPATLAFPTQNQGTTSLPLTLTVTNTGNLNLNVTGVTISGTNSGDFAQTNTCNSVAPQSTCSVSVTFTPSIAGSESANVSITDDAPQSPQIEPVTGTGIVAGSPFVVLSSRSLTFATQLVGTSSASQSVTLSNTGSGTLNITSLASSGDYKQTNTCGSTVASGANCTITVTFTPKGINARSGAITITDNATGSPQTVALSGIGTYVVISPVSLAFGNVTVGMSSAAQTVTVTNTAKTAMAVRSVAVTGANIKDFAETNTCGTSVGAGASCSISVTFTPTAIGARKASLSIIDAGGASPQVVSLTGTGQ
ncbi:MAG TPA: choice-of-anchor D domain-containing protein [Candidatus Sulfotelmatobacter sp.]|nr:choice-of-anchor D domain-containing protein [Candidatus Sulfotelmatobacter sp.]